MTPVASGAGELRLHLGGHSIPVRLPNRRDKRLHLAVVLLSLQAIGQIGLGFQLSVAQILLSIGSGALFDLLLTLRRERALVWPASGMLTGNSVAFFLRTTGTQHGDWWSLNGAGFFVAATLTGLVLKHALRLGDRHVYNPSNIGLVLVLLGFGPDSVYPQPLSFGPISGWLALAGGLIVLGTVWVLRPLRMLTMVAAFLATFAIALAVVAGTGGRCYLSGSPPQAVCGTAYWVALMTSPELLIFVLFMMSDPRTAPATQPARAIYAVVTALVAADLILPQVTEFGVEVALLSSLTVACSLVPLIDRLARSRRAGGRRIAASPRRRPDLRTLISLAAVGLICAAVPVAAMGIADHDGLAGVNIPAG